MQDINNIISANIYTVATELYNKIEKDGLLLLLFIHSDTKEDFKEHVLNSLKWDNVFKDLCIEPNQQQNLKDNLISNVSTFYDVLKNMNEITLNEYIEKIKKH